MIISDKPRGWVPPSAPWKPVATLATLRRKADFLKSVRLFFEQRDVMEVETPLLSHTTATDPHLDSFEVNSGSQGGNQYLLTSPEFEMKRLLAAGSGSIFQIAKAFRQGEEGRLHNPEFSILEWYRPGFSLPALRAEVNELLRFLGWQQAPVVLSYRQAFVSYVGIDPFVVPTHELLNLASELANVDSDSLDRNDALDFILAHSVEPALADLGTVYVCDYPPSQAALANIGQDKKGADVAMRFELYINGIEIANAYDELFCEREQYARCRADNEKRQRLGKQTIPVDPRLLAALPSLPVCAGIALGLDRLFMVIEGSSSLQDVLAFPAGTV